VASSGTSKRGRRGLGRRGGSEAPGRRDKGAAGWARHGRGTRRAQCVRAAFVANLTMATTSSRESSQLVLG
jgi:hypothetical protein